MSAWHADEVGGTACGLPCADGHLGHHPAWVEDEVDGKVRDTDEAHAGDVNSPRYPDEFSPAVRRLARAAGLTDAAIKKRYSRTAQRSYTSFGCSECDAIYGDWFVRTDFFEAVYDPPVFAVEPVPGGPRIVPRPHWCLLNEDRAHCDSTTAPPQSLPLAGRYLGIGLGDRFKVFQGASGLFEGGVRLADETGVTAGKTS